MFGQVVRTDELPDLLGGQRLGEQETLPPVAALVLQVPQLRIFLDALGDG